VPIDEFESFHGSVSRSLAKEQNKGQTMQEQEVHMRGPAIEGMCAIEAEYAEWPGESSNPPKYSRLLVVNECKFKEAR
jgi:hypothetical protein